MPEQADIHIAQLAAGYLYPVDKALAAILLQIIQH